MAEKTINTRILLKYDTYANWTTNNPVLKAGEVAIATIASGNTQEVNSVTAPQVLIKVGDGTSTYSALPFVSAKAADVYGWAKADKKPTYSATEITGIGDYIAQYVDETLGISVDTDTQYRITRVDDYNYELQSKAKGEADTAFVDVGTIVIPKYDDTQVKADITALENLVGTTAVATQISNALATYALKSELPTKVSQLENDKGYLTSHQDISGKVDKVEGKGLSTNDLTDTLKANYDAAYNHSQTAHAPANAQANVIESVKVNGTAQTITDKAVNITVPTKVSDLTNDSGYLTEHQDISGKADKATTLAGYGITDGYTKGEGEALAERVGDTEDAIGVLNGTGAGSVSKTVTDAINEFAAKVSDDGTVNTYKELIDYAAEHGAEFTELVGEVNANAEAIETLNGTGAGSVDKKIADAIAAQNLGQYATDSEMTAATGRISTLEGEMDTAQADIEALETEVAKKANTADLAAIAKTGNVNDLVQTSGDVLIFNCGDSNC